MKSAKKVFSFVLVLALVISLLTVSNQAEAKSSPKLNYSKITVYTGSSKVLKVKNIKKKVTWSTSNKKIAKVTKGGKVTGVKKGTCRVYAKVSGKKLTCKVTVKAKSVRKTTSEAKTTEKKTTEKTTEKTTTEQPTKTKTPAEVCAEQGHVWIGGYKDHTMSSCYLSGKTGENKCLRCGKVETFVYDIVEHTWADGIYRDHTMSNCSLSGTMGMNYCVVCGKTENFVYDTVNHDIVTERVEPTCEKSGTEKVYCKSCGKVTSSKSLPAIGHKWITDVNIVWDCCHTGHKELHCEYCGQVDEYDTKKPATISHTGDIIYKYENVDVDGILKYCICEYCLDCNTRLNTMVVGDEEYTYSVTPLTDDVCWYFYVKTENPNPESFRFVDESTTLNEEGKCYISMYDKAFADVSYIDQKTLRVKDGYIFYGCQTDGGKWKLEYKVDGDYVATEVTVTVPQLKSSTQYLIDTYTTSYMSFFQKMDAVQDGLNIICLYSGVWVRGDLKKNTALPYYGLSTSPHVDQSFYIQKPYYRIDNKPMLLSKLYPYILDSIGFPSQLAAVAEELDSTATYEWNDNDHSLVDVTYNGVTRSYGGQGYGGGQEITADLVEYKYSFDETAGDAYNNRSWREIKNMIMDYGKLEVPEEEKDLPKLTWEDVRNTVGTEGSYVKLVLIDSIFGGVGEGYTFLYKKSDRIYPGYFSNAWYDGRYFNSHEFFEKGTTFDDAYTASIIIKDACIPFPQSSEGKYYLYRDNNIDMALNYDKSTGVWSGFMQYSYDAKSNTWIASVYRESKYWDTESGTYLPIEDEDFKAACTLTLEEVEAMQVDRNSNVEPGSYYIYDMTMPPGTRVE